MGAPYIDYNVADPVAPAVLGEVIQLGTGQEVGVAVAANESREGDVPVVVQSCHGASMHARSRRPAPDGRNSRSRDDPRAAAGRAVGRAAPSIG